MSHKDAGRVGTWESSSGGKSILSRTTGTENVTASVTFKVTAAKPGIYNAYMKSDHDTLCNRLNNVNVFITDKHGTKKKIVDQTDLHLNQKWYNLGQVYVDSTSTTRDLITVTNAGGDRYDQLISVGNIKLVSQEAYQVPDVSFTEEQCAIFRQIFGSLDINNDGVLTSAGLGSQSAVTFLESLGERGDEAQVILEETFAEHGTINSIKFLKIAQEEFLEYFTLFSDNEGGIRIDIADFLKRLDLVAAVPSDDSSSLPLLLSPLVSRLLSLTPEERLADISSFDRDGDGNIDFQEFTNAILFSFLPTH